MPVSTKEIHSALQAKLGMVRYDYLSAKAKKLYKTKTIDDLKRMLAYDTV